MSVAVVAAGKGPHDDPYDAGSGQAEEVGDGMAAKAQWGEPRGAAHRTSSRESGASVHAEHLPAALRRRIAGDPVALDRAGARRLFKGPWAR